MEFVSRLANLSDIFDTQPHEHVFSRSKQHYSRFYLKIASVFKKIDLWITNTEAKQCHVFKVLSSLQHSEKLFQEICCHLKLVKSELMHYFPNIDVRMFQIRSLWIHSFYLLEPKPIKCRLEQENKKKSLTFCQTRQLK